MAGVDHLVVYMQTAVKYSSLYIHQMVRASHFPIFLGPNPVVVYIFGVPIALSYGSVRECGAPKPYFPAPGPFKTGRGRV